MTHQATASAECRFIGFNNIKTVIENTSDPRTLHAWQLVCYTTYKIATPLLYSNGVVLKTARGCTSFYAGRRTRRTRPDDPHCSRLLTKNGLMKLVKTFTCTGELSGIQTVLRDLPRALKTNFRYEMFFVWYAEHSRCEGSGMVIYSRMTVESWTSSQLLNHYVSAFGSESEVATSMQLGFDLVMEWRRLSGHPGPKVELNYRIRPLTLQSDHVSPRLFKAIVNVPLTSRLMPFEDAIILFQDVVARSHAILSTSKDDSLPNGDTTIILLDLIRKSGHLWPESTQVWLALPGNGCFRMTE